ncbi:MAG: redoxin family protein, partial [Gemmataceae bacterium]|nr:redoxin family protein [Gemmataceae bacterium]
MRVFIAVAGCWLILGTSAAGMESPEAARPIGVGDKAPDLTFKDIRYLPRSLADFGPKKAFVLAFTTIGCPLVERYLPVLQKLESAYRGRGVQFVAINVSADDSIVAMAGQAVEHNLEFPVVRDFDRRWPKALGVTRTPQVVVLDGERRLRYRGRIDDQYRLGGARAEPTRRDLQQALDEVLAGKAVTVAETPVDGCLIPSDERPPPIKEVTYADHIAPLLAKHCVVCHQAGTAAPFALVTYGQVKARAAMIGEVVREQRMPPWNAHPKWGRFANQRVLSDAERELVAHWVRSGAPAGDLSRLPPPPPEKKERWLIGTPDLVLQDLATYKIP